MFDLGDLIVNIEHNLDYCILNPTELVVSCSLLDAVAFSYGLRLVYGGGENLALSCR
jgi:hypothetical protein